MSTTEARVRIAQHVHYTSYGTPGGEFGKECRAAIVTEVDRDDPDLIGLTAANPTGLFFHPLAAGGCRHDGVDVATGITLADGEHRPKIEPGPSGRAGGTWHLIEDC
jgi:hypothetical protein